MFSYFRRCLLIFRAQRYFRNSLPIPLDLYADLVGEGVDVTELERTTRNG